MRRSTRSARQAARNIRYINGERLTRKQNKPLSSFLEYSLVNGNILLIGDVIDMLPELKHRKDGYIKNDILKVVRCDKVGLFYSSRQKMFMWLAINDNYTIYILYKDKKLSLLPNISNIKLENPKYQIIEQANRLIWSVYQRNDIHDLSMNPILIYKVGEIFKR
jgi:hypothetical protein